MNRIPVYDCTAARNDRFVLNPGAKALRLKIRRTKP